MDKAHIKVGLIQMRCFRDKAESINRACDMLEEAADQGVQIACLPELFASDYFCKTEDAGLFELAEPIPGATSTRIAELARRRGMHIITPLFEKRTAGVYHNTSILLDDQGEIAGKYRKMHIPDDPLFYEKFYFTPGDADFQAFDTPHLRLGMLICWDQWYPEAARLTAMQGAELLLYPTAIGWLPAEKEAYGEAQCDMWETAQRAHAIANGCFVAVANRVGFEEVTSDIPPHASGGGVLGGGIEFWGSSFIADPYGRIIAKASTDKEEVLMADIDIGLIEKTRQEWPFFRDRRIDAYGDITRRFGNE